MEGWLSFFADDTTNINPWKTNNVQQSDMREQLTSTWNPNITLK
ncbi:MAG TPA: hypothetical protein VK699_11530 [Terriglobales bacterium]|jgi:hypothetical protein|nr:hypothetical protein [Terriglobales bacterium]